MIIIIQIQLGLEKGSGSDTTYQKGRLYYNKECNQLTSNQYYESGNTMSIYDKNSRKLVLVKMENL